MTPSKQKNKPPQATSLASLAARPAFLGLLLAAATFAVFWPVVGCDFLNYDDPYYFASNLHVQAGLAKDSVLWAFRATDNASWYPLTWLSYMLDADLFGTGSLGPHFTNLLLHAANSGLLFLLLRHLTGAHWRSAAVAALFALHPLRVESVAWISERKGLLSTLFGLLTLWAYARYGQKRSRVEGRGSRADHPVPALGARRWTLDYGLALLFFALGLLSKPMLVTLPFVLLLLDYWPLNRVSGAGCEVSGVRCQVSWAGQVSTLLRLLWEKVPFFVLAAMSCVGTVWVHKEYGAFTALASVSFTARIENAFVSYARYLGKTLWPANLALPYPHPGHWPWMWVALAAMLVAGLCVAAVVLRGRRPYVFVGWFWFVGTLLPVIGLVQWGVHSMADRFTYVPSIGLFIVLTWGIDEAFTRWRLAKELIGIAAGLVLLACTARTRDQLRLWQNSETLFSHAIAVTENNSTAHFNLAMTLQNKGRYEEAIEHYRISLELKPDNAPALDNLGSALAAVGKVEDALASFRQALQVNPDDAEVHNNWGGILYGQGNVDEAIEHYTEALRLKPDYADAHSNLGVALVSKGRLAEAIDHYRIALRTKPNSAVIYRNLGKALLRDDRVDEAIASFRASLQIDPHSAIALVNLGDALVRKKQYDDAIASYEAALRVSPESFSTLQSLGHAYAEEGHFAEAAQCYNQALGINASDPQLHFDLGCALAQLGRRTDAIAVLKEALRLRPDFPEARQQLSKLGVPAPDQAEKNPP